MDRWGKLQAEATGMKESYACTPESRIQVFLNK